MEIRAAVARKAHGPFAIETARLDRPRAGEVRVRMVATGICHSDLSVVEQIVPLPLPMVLGHEGAGVVDEVGEGVRSVVPGDHVVLTFASCGHCPRCDDGHPAYCKSFMSLNNSGRRLDGTTTICDHTGAEVNAAYFSQSSFATHAIAVEQNTVKVRRDAPLELLGPLGCGFITGAGTVMNVLRPRQGQSIAILGAGALGFAALFAAKLANCGRIVAVDRVASRLELARELGATHTIDTSKVDLAAELASLGPLDFAFDTTGVPRIIAAAVEALDVCGVCALVGASAERRVSLDILGMIPGKVVRGVIEGDVDPHIFIPRLVDLFMEGKFPIDRLSRFYPFEKINAAAADAASGKTIKPILQF